MELHFQELGERVMTTDEWSPKPRFFVLKEANMETWMVIVIGIICILAGFIFGVWHESHSRKVVGTLFIDGKTIYTVWDVEPQSMDEGGKILMDVHRVNIAQRWESQQNQGA